MKTKFEKILVLITIFFLISCSEQKKELSTEDIDSTNKDVPLIQTEKIVSIDTLQIMFGFTDQSGKKIITDLNDSIIDQAYHLIERDGNIVNITFKEKRMESEDSNHRQTADNFEKTGGNLFDISTKNVESDNTFLIISQNSIQKYKPQKINNYDLPDTYSQDTSKIAILEQREINNFWFKGTFGNSGSIYVVHFKNNGKVPLAGLYIINNGQIVKEEYEGNVRDEGSVWRVDDGGEFDGNSINILGIFLHGDKIIVGRSWAGIEGENNKLLLQNKNEFVVLKEDYRYWVSE